MTAVVPAVMRKHRKQKWADENEGEEDDLLNHDHGAPPFRARIHPGGNPGANLKSISHRCHPILVAFASELTQETIHLPLGCLQGG